MVLLDKRISMSLVLSLTPNSYAFSGNPIRMDVFSSSPLTYTIGVDGKLVFEGSVEAGESYVYIDEIIQSALKPTRFTGEETDPLLEDLGNMASFIIQASNDDGDTASAVTEAVYGGISKRMIRNLDKIGSNIFTYKILNPVGNFLLSNRGNDRILRIKETELLPVLFIASEEQLVIKATDSAMLQLDTERFKCYGLNVAAIRKHFFHENNILANKLQVITSKGVAFTIVITPANVERYRYFLDFLNSYGAYERIEITGNPINQPEPEEEELFGVFDKNINDYSQNRNRVSSVDVFTVRTGFKEEHEIPVIIDMLSSDEIYFVGYEEHEIRVNVTAEGFEVTRNSAEPQEFALHLRSTDPESYYTGELSSNVFGNPRIHTEQFDKKFN